MVAISVRVARLLLKANYARNRTNRDRGGTLRLGIGGRGRTFVIRYLGDTLDTFSY